MNCNAVREALPLYLDNMLSEVQVEMVEEHLMLCDECKAVLNDLKQLRSILSVVPEVYIPDSFDGKLRNALQETVQETSETAYNEEFLIFHPDELNGLDEFGHPDFLNNENMMVPPEISEPIHTPAALDEMEVRPLEFENVDEGFLPASAPVKEKPVIRWKRVSAIAAVLVVGLISILTLNQNQDVPSTAPQNDQAMMATMEKSAPVPSMTWDSAKGTENEEAYYQELITLTVGEGSNITESYKDAEGIWHFKVSTASGEIKYTGRDGEIWTEE